MTLSPQQQSSRATAWGALLVVIAAHAAYWSGFEMPGRTARSIVLLVAPAVLFVSAGLWWRRSPRTTWLAALIGCVLLLAGLGLVTNGSSLRFAIQPTLSLVFLLAIAWWSHANAGSALDRALCTGAAGALLVVTPFALFEAYIGPTFFATAQPPAGPYVNRNVAAQAMVCLVPLAAAGRSVMSTRLFANLSLVAAASGCVLLIATRSRGGLLAALVGWGLAAAVYVWWSRRSGAALRPSTQRSQRLAWR